MAKRIGLMAGEPAPGVGGRRFGLRRDTAGGRATAPVVAAEKSPSAAQAETGTAARARVAAVPIDLVAVALWALLGTLTVLGGGPLWARLVLGLPLVLFLPGYAVGGALFPARDGPDGIERVGLGFALSLAVVPPTALLLERSAWGIALTPMIVALLAVALAGSAVGGVRRGRLRPAERFLVAVAPPRIPPPRSWGTVSRLAVGLGAAAVLLLVVGGGPILVGHLRGERLTEFSLAAADGRPQYFARALTVGQHSEVRLAVANHEGRPVRYALSIVGAEPVDPLPTIALQPGERWEAPLRYVVNNVGERQAVVFELRQTGAGDSAAAYRSLRLVVDVAEPGAGDGGRP